MAPHATEVIEDGVSKGKLGDPVGFLEPNVKIV